MIVFPAQPSKEMEIFFFVYDGYGVYLNLVLFHKSRNFGIIKDRFLKQENICMHTWFKREGLLIFGFMRLPSSAGIGLI